MLDANNTSHIKSFEKCRNITKEVINFGVNENEILKIIELLSYELESSETMKKVNEALKLNKTQTKIEKNNIII